MDNSATVAFANELLKARGIDTKSFDDAISETFQEMLKVLFEKATPWEEKDEGCGLVFIATTISLFEAKSIALRTVTNASEHIRDTIHNAAMKEAGKLQKELNKSGPSF
jgi:hypothetical protein